jgi:bacterioferritin-associated ferredoxin
MYVCICKGVTDHQIRDSVEAGARDWRDVQQDTGCGTQCGRCACTAKSIMRDAVKTELMAGAEGLAYAV